MPEKEGSDQTEMAWLHEFRETVVELMGRYVWLPYLRVTRCSNSAKFVCRECADNPDARPHGPYLRLIRCLPSGKKDHMHMGKIDEEGVITGRGIEPVELTLAGLIALNSGEINDRSDALEVMLNVNKGQVQVQSENGMVMVRDDIVVKLEMEEDE